MQQRQINATANDRYERAESSTKVRFELLAADVNGVSLGELAA
ncbi:MAG: hypothetical protein OJF51_004201 [Nitrospira sp.]|nr:MAG: hypothetical protein OJF51_004201 [Nitrospira sp.]